MAIILYKETEEGWEAGKFEVEAMHRLISAGWVVSKENQEEKPDEPILLEDMPNEEIRALAKAANLENWDDARIKTLIGKLRALNGTTER